MSRPPVRLRDAAGLLAGLLVLLVSLRAAFWLAFRSSDAPASAQTIAGAFYLGLKFDLRLAVVLVTPYLLLAGVLDPRGSRRALRFWGTHYALVTGILVLLHAIDFAHYAYLRTRLESASLRFLEDPWISLRMVWESYPVLKSLLGVAALVFVAYRAAVAWLRRRARPDTLRRSGRIAWNAGTVLAILAGLYGKLSYYPLRWSDAFASPHHLASYLALNPCLFFFDTLCTEEQASVDRDALAARYPRVAEYLGVEDPDPETLSFARRVRPTPLLDGDPNVVVILMESFAAHSTGVFGNPLDPSPNFDRIAREGITWTRFYTPRVGTARAVFCLVTGIPDTTTRRTASRNPRVVTQRTILDSLQGYEKHYFLGGSANWANIRGLLAHNVEGLRIHEEGSYPGAPRVDVWGLSDLHLFEQVNAVLRRAESPFLAIVHLSGNHPPYTIPEDNRGFAWRDVPAEDLRNAGFASLEEFNSFRFLDHSLGFYFDLASREDYFRNTLFVLLGDNGSQGLAANQPEPDRRFGLRSHHTPLVIYASDLDRAGEVHDQPATQMDVMATVAGAVGQPVLNTTLGRNLLDPRFERLAFIQGQRGPLPQACILGDGSFTRVDIDGSNPTLDTFAEALVADPEARLRDHAELALGLYHASRWLLYNNRRPAER